MVKGVSKLMLEIVRPDSEYFERVLLVVRPEYADSLSPERLSGEAERIMRGAALRLRGKRFSAVGMLLLSALLGAVFTGAVVALILLL